MTDHPYEPEDPPYEGEFINCKWCGRPKGLHAITLQEVETEDVTVKAEGTVTHGPGTRVITITIFAGNVPTEKPADEPIDLDALVGWLTDMTDQWVVESRTW